MIVKTIIKKILILLIAMPAFAQASGGEVQLDHAPINLHDQASLQRGAKYFVNYCLNCHAASYMRFSRLQDLGLTEQQIKDNLMFTTDKIGDTMTTALNPIDAKDWFGGVPPDLSVVSRSRGSDWLYTYLRRYYRDDTSPTGWNNEAFPNVGMPHVLQELQGTQAMKQVGERKGHDGKIEPILKLVVDKPGTLNTREYDQLVADLVNYITYMGEPSRSHRTQIGVIALFFLGVLFVLALMLKHEYWKDIK